MSLAEAIQMVAGNGASAPLKLRGTEERVPDSQGAILVMGGLLADQLSEAPSRAGVIAATGRSLGWSTIRFNYPGHGKLVETRSDGSLSELSLTRMLDAACDVLIHFAPKRVAIVGSSIGAGLMPFLASRASAMKIEVVGALGVSSVPAAALASFIYRQLDPESRQRFDAGEVVEIRSPTLDEPFTLHRSQIADLKDFDYAGLRGPLDAKRVRLLVGGTDPISTPSFNLTLASALGGSQESVVVLPEEGHEISYHVMERELRSWLVAL